MVHVVAHVVARPICKLQNSGQLSGSDRRARKLAEMAETGGNGMEIVERGNPSPSPSPNPNPSPRTTPAHSLVTPT